MGQHQHDQMHSALSNFLLLQTVIVDCIEHRCHEQRQHLRSAKIQVYQGPTGREINRYGKGNSRKRVRQDVHDFEVDENYVVLSTQGKRPSMEDSYDVFIDANEQFNIFSVYDGHGGYECAEFCKTHFKQTCI